jgi:hypothetical protein
LDYHQLSKVDLYLLLLAFQDTIKIGISNHFDILLDQETHLLVFDNGLLDL